MRVVGGTFRGRTLLAPPGGRTRPTGDRVREAVFDMLASRLELAGCSVVDLFAGSGALGIEAVSRGAASAVFVDAAAAALRAVRANLAALGLAPPVVRVVRADALAWVRRSGPFDLALCDPPYAFEEWSELLGALRAGTAVLESSRPPPLTDDWAVIREKRYGGTLVTVVEHRFPESKGRP
jgi:16S rRNA (guanine966-N2)-methyltransferase